MQRSHQDLNPLQEVQAADPTTESIRRRLSEVTLFLVGVLLLGFGSLKIYGLQTNPIPRFGWFARPEVQFLAGQWEILLGIWLVTGCSRLAAWLATLTTFCAFASLSAYLGWNGIANCGCFGTFKSSPWTAFGLDLAIIVSLALIGPPKPQFCAIEANPRMLTLIPRGASIPIFTVLLFVGMTVWTYCSYGSLRIGFSRLIGTRITIDEPYLDLGSVKPGDVIERAIVLRNWSNDALRIVGASETCVCSIRTPMPAVVPPGGTLALQVLMAIPRSSPGVFSQKLSLWTDSDCCRVLRLEYGGLLIQESSIP
jgi:hypothetical protein